MNDLLVCAADVGTAFLYGYTKEKVYVIAGPEFGEHKGKPLIIHRGIYGLRTSSARFHEHLALRIRQLGLSPSKTDPDLYIREVDNDHYEYLATYVDDILVFSKHPMRIINELKKTYMLKGVGEPQYYLGGYHHLHRRTLGKGGRAHGSEREDLYQELHRTIGATDGEAIWD